MPPEALPSVADIIYAAFAASVGSAVLVTGFVLVRRALRAL